VSPEAGLASAARGRANGTDVTVGPSRVLHVDDDADIRFLVELALDQAPDLVLRSYASGDEALTAALAEPPDLALVDVMMPGMDGISLAHAFQRSEVLRSIPIVFVTAKGSPEDVATLRAAGAAEVLVKPFDLRALERIIHDALDI
jgi:two-component system, OmpR family, response regulator